MPEHVANLTQPIRPTSPSVHQVTDYGVRLCAGGCPDPVAPDGPLTGAHLPRIRAPAGRSARPSLTHTCRDTKAPCQLSEIRLVRARYLGVLSSIVFMRVFGADIFTSASSAPIADRGAPISYGRRPGHREDAFILDRELKLQVLAPIVGVAVGGGRNRIRRKMKIFFCGSF